MTSTSLFFKRVRNEGKRSLWAFALEFIVYFFTLPVGCLVMLSRIDGGVYQKQDVIEDLAGYLGSRNLFLVVCVVLAAVIGALSQFHYLQSKKQSDFYESMPVTRKELFLVKAVTGLMMYLISYWCNVFLAFLALSARGCLTEEIVKTIFVYGFYHLIGFLLLYITAIAAVLLSGTLIVSMLVLVFAFWAGPAAYLIYRQLMAYFFQTYYAQEEINMNIMQGTSFLTPYINLIVTAGDGKDTGWIVVGILAAIVIIYFVALYVYRIRKAEDAQKSIIFKPVFVFIKFITVIICSYGFALLMETVTDNRRTGGWFIFGLVMGMFLSSALVEIMQNSDFKCAFAHKKHLLVLAGVIAISFVIFRFDVFGYDSYLPDADHIESAAIDFKQIDLYTDGVDFSSSQLEYMNTHKYRLTYMKLTETEDVLALAKVGIDNAKEKTFTEYDEGYQNVTVKYRLKNGKEICREYEIKDLYTMEEFDHIYNQEAYKMGVFPVLSIPDEAVSQIYCEREGILAQLGKSPNQIAELVNVYKEELKGLTVQEVKEEAPIAILQFLYPSGIHFSTQLQIYPSFTKTIELIREYGFPLSETMNLSKIQQITIYGVLDEGLFSVDTNVYGGRDYVIKETASSQPNGSVTITDPEVIAKIYPYLEPEDLASANEELHAKRTDYWAEARIESGEYEQVYNVSYFFKNEELPKELVQLLEESIH